MTIHLSSHDLDRLAHAIHLLVSPLDHDTVDAWRSAVNGHLSRLLCADTSGFLLPISDGLAMYSDEHDPGALASFPELQPPLLADGRTVWEEGVRAGVTTVKRAYGSAYNRFSDSPYYNEYAAANRAYDTLGATIAVPEIAANAVASLHFWHSRPVGRSFGDRELGILRLLLPAFQAGVDAQLRWGSARSDLLRTLDALGHAVEVFSRDGRSLHRTPALNSLLGHDPDRAIVAAEISTVMNTIRAAAFGSIGEGAPAFSCTRNVQTATARYSVRACVHAGPQRRSETCMLVSVDKLTPTRHPDAELRALFGLTRTELRVAALLADGKTNADVATELGVSSHTARRHTEHVMLKMGIHSRAQVATRLFF